VGRLSDCQVDHATGTLTVSSATPDLATLWMAIVADVGASVAVILNGIRLRWIGT
jgi:cation transport ATPase